MTVQGKDIKVELADEAVRIVTGARRSAYGKPEDNFARIARLWNDHLINRGIVAPGTLIEPRDVGILMILMKIARLAESPDHRDSVVDMLGYSLCYGEMSLPISDVAFRESAALQTPPVDKFKVGDKVYWDNCAGEREFCEVIGRHAVPPELPQGEAYDIRYANGGTGWNYANIIFLALENIPSPPLTPVLEEDNPTRTEREQEGPMFKVGDKVNPIDGDPYSERGVIDHIVGEKYFVKWPNGVVGKLGWEADELVRVP